MGIVELVIIAAMVVFNGVFAGYEIALAAVTAARLQVLVRENRPAVALIFGSSVTSLCSRGTAGSTSITSRDG